MTNNCHMKHNIDIKEVMFILYALDIKGIEKIIDLPIKLHEAKSLSTNGDTLKIYRDNELKKLLNIIKHIEEI